MVTLTMASYGKRHVFIHATVRDAALDVCADIETNEACPISIEEDGVLVWRNGGPTDGSYDMLRELAGMAVDS